MKCPLFRRTLLFQSRMSRLALQLHQQPQMMVRLFASTPWFLTDPDLIFDSEMALPEKKKKKKKKEKTLDDLDALDDAEGLNLSFPSLILFPVPQESSAAAEPAEADHGYVYEVLLQRIFAIMKQKNPEMASGEKKHIVLKPPQVRFLLSHARSHLQVHRLGTRRTAFANFTEYCKMYFSRFPSSLIPSGFIGLLSTSRIS